jgi:drug/metabolite transporter (DMT)-like permease
MDVFVACGLGFSVTTLLLFCSYSLIPVGMATTLHFVYPIAVSLACIVFFREKLSFSMLFALFMCTVGVVLFTGNASSLSAKGIAMALASGLTYAFFLVYVDKSALRNMNHFKISFWMGVMLVIFAGAFGALTGTLPLKLTANAWILAGLLSIAKAVIAVTTLQIGIQLSGAATAAILSTLEPITSFALGALILGEGFSTAKVIGVVSVVIAVATISARKK